MHARGCLAFRVAAVVVRCLRRGVAAPHSRTPLLVSTWIFLSRGVAAPHRRTPLLVSTWIGVLVRCVRRGVAAPHRRSSLPAAARAVLLCVRLRLVLLCVRRSFGRSGDHPPHDRDCPNDRHCGRCHWGGKDHCNPPNERECRATHHDTPHVPKHCPKEGECPKHCPSKTTWPHHRCLGLSMLLRATRGGSTLCLGRATGDCGRHCGRHRHRHRHRGRYCGRHRHRHRHRGRYCGRHGRTPLRGEARREQQRGRTAADMN